MTVIAEPRQNKVGYSVATTSAARVGRGICTNSTDFLVTHTEKQTLCGFWGLHHQAPTGALPLDHDGGSAPDPLCCAQASSKSWLRHSFSVITTIYITVIKSWLSFFYHTLSWYLFCSDRISVSTILLSYFLTSSSFFLLSILLLSLSHCIC